MNSIFILKDLSSEALKAANDGNLAAMLPLLGKMGQTCENHPVGVKRSITNIPIPLFNSIMETRLAPDEVEAAIEIVQEDARGQNVPVLWWIGPTDRPGNLDSYLECSGFQLNDDGPGMAVDLDHINTKLASVPGLSFELARDENSRRQWSHTTGLGFEAPEPAIELLENYWCKLLSLTNPDILLAYIGLLGGQPVASSMLLLAAGVAGIYSVATIPSARRKGIGAWMTLYPLLYARYLGYRVGILQSSPMGLHVYQSLGFKEFCRVRTYEWRP